MYIQTLKRLYQLIGLQFRNQRRTNDTKYDESNIPRIHL